MLVGDDVDAEQGFADRRTGIRDRGRGGRRDALRPRYEGLGMMDEQWDHDMIDDKMTDITTKRTILRKVVTTDCTTKHTVYHERPRRQR